MYVPAATRMVSPGFAATSAALIVLKQLAFPGWTQRVEAWAGCTSITAKNKTARQTPTAVERNTEIKRRIIFHLLCSY
jgi:hypothetical protein